MRLNLAKKCFILSVGFAVLVIIGFSNRATEFWKYSQDKQALLDKEIRDIIEFGKAMNKIEQQQHQEQQKLQNQPSNLEKPNIRPWYLSGGTIYPSEGEISSTTIIRGSTLLSSEAYWSDRVIDQLMFVPPFYEQFRSMGQLKKILLYNGFDSYTKRGQKEFLECPVNTCTLTANRDTAGDANLIIYSDNFNPSEVIRQPKQIYMLLLNESPYNTQFINYPDIFNWTATYRTDSDIVKPYGKWVYYDAQIKQITQDRNYALNKTKKVAWFVSNCEANNSRLEYAYELQKYIQVDIYGSCGSYRCPRNIEDSCFEILQRHYKFYLAFENSNCKEYITEKFFYNALIRNILPIVMGARPEDYENAAPYRSYIHVDDFESANELADYLHVLDQNDDLYNTYFNWMGTGEFIDTHFWCRVCAMLHDEVSLEKPKWYENVNDWWLGPGTCTSGTWRDVNENGRSLNDWLSKFLF